MMQLRVKACKTRFRSKLSPLSRLCRSLRTWNVKTDTKHINMAYTAVIQPNRHQYLQVDLVSHHPSLSYKIVRDTVSRAMAFCSENMMVLHIPKTSLQTFKLNIDPALTFRVYDIDTHFVCICTSTLACQLVDVEDHESISQFMHANGCDPAWTMLSLLLGWCVFINKSTINAMAHTPHQMRYLESIGTAVEDPVLCAQVAMLLAYIKHNKHMPTHFLHV